MRNISLIFIYAYNQVFDFGAPPPPPHTQGGGVTNLLT